MQKFQQKSEKKQWWKLIIWVIVFYGGYYFYDNSAYQSAIDESVFQEYDSYEVEETFVISSGNSPTFIAESLEEKNLISSSKYFLRYLEKNNIDSKLYAGSYELKNSMTLSEIAKKLTTKAEFVKILIPEGLTISEIDARLAQKNIFEAGEFETCVLKTCDFSDFDFISDYTILSKREYLEGYFFPATYKIKETELTPQNFANKMLEAFEMRATKLNILKGKNERTLQEIVTMASIIEKESSSHAGDESNMISGILWNRIEKSIPLGADATIRYALQKDSSALTRSDLLADNKFNTRKYKGLPPHAITNAGESSLMAAVNPTNTDFLFYLHDKNKKIHYAVTNAQHENNKTKFCGGSCE